MAKQNLFVKNLKNISKSINSLLERNLNKLKFNNLKIIVSNNKIILTFVALFILFVTYLLVPTFYIIDNNIFTDIDTITLADDSYEYSVIYTASWPFHEDSL